jgi:gas vesicle protein
LLKGDRNMSQQDGFVGGFLLGTLIGGVVGGIVGAVIATRLDNDLEEDIEVSESEGKRKKKQINASEEESLEIESTRRSLENKIAQLNATIDDVRRQLGNVNANSSSQINESSLLED